MLLLKLFEMEEFYIVILKIDGSVAPLRHSYSMLFNSFWTQRDTHKTNYKCFRIVSYEKEEEDELLACRKKKKKIK